MAIDEEMFEKNETLEEMAEAGALVRLGNGTYKVADDLCGLPEEVWKERVLDRWEVWKAKAEADSREKAAEFELQEAARLGLVKPLGGDRYVVLKGIHDLTPQEQEWFLAVLLSTGVPDERAVSLVTDEPLCLSSPETIEQ